VFLYWLHITERFPRLIFTRRVKPVRFSILAGLFSFALLPILPHHPLTIPLAFGTGLSISLIVTSIRSTRLV